MYIDRLDNVVNEYHNTYSTIKMKHVGVNSSTYSDFDVEDNDKDPKLEVGDYVRISKSKKKLGKGYAPNWLEDVFMIKKLKSTVR